MMTEIEIFGWTVSLTGKHSFRGIFIFYFFIFFGLENLTILLLLFSVQRAVNKK